MNRRDILTELLALGAAAGPLGARGQAQKPAPGTKRIGLLVTGWESTRGHLDKALIEADVELAAIAQYQPFSSSLLKAAQALNIAFHAEALDAASQKKLLALKTDIDDFHVHGREVYWLCRKKQSESTFSNVVLEKTIGRASTMRGINTIQKMAAKFAV